MKNKLIQSLILVTGLYLPASITVHADTHNDAITASKMNAVETYKSQAVLASQINVKSADLAKQRLLEKEEAEKKAAEEAAKKAEEDAKLARKEAALNADLSTDLGRRLYVEYVGDVATPIAKSHDVYTSVMIAQLLLESNYGRSGLSADYHNYFGIKGSYKGQTTNMKTQEDDGTGSKYSITDGFRVYSSMEESMSDYADLLNKDIYRGARKSQTASYKEALEHLEGLYATDTSYAESLQTLIDRYDLTRFDN